MTPTTLASRRFLEQYQALSPYVRASANLAIRQLITRSESGTPPTRSRQIRDVEGVTPKIWRAKLGDNPRLLFRWEAQLILLAVGPHRVLDDYSSRQLSQDLKSLTSIPTWLLNSILPSDTFFDSRPDKSVELLDEAEIEPRWVYYLDEEQDRVTSELLDVALSADKRRSAAVHFVIGGPGTGKTCVLLNLLDILRNQPSLQVRIRLTPEVAEYVQSGMGFDIAPLLDRDGDFGGPQPRVLLVDDPASASTIASACEFATLAQRQVVIFAFDPLQLAEAVSDADFASICRRYKVTLHELKRCYRQKKNVGNAAKKAMDAIAASTPFLEKGKIGEFREDHAHLTSLCNSVEFCNPSGYVETYADAKLSHIQAELRRLDSSSGALWTHWPPLLVAIDPGLPDSIQESVRNYFKAASAHAETRVTHVVYALADVTSLKGVEFQHVFLFISPSLYKEVNRGFRGSGKHVYNSRRLLRIPFTRAKDSLVTFVIKRAI